MADTTRSRVFTAQTSKGVLGAFDMVNPEARLHECDLTSGLSGRSQSSTMGIRSSYDVDEEHKPEAVRRFDQARRGWLEANDVIDIRSLKTLKKLLKR